MNSAVIQIATFSLVLVQLCNCASFIIFPGQEKQGGKYLIPNFTNKARSQFFHTSLFL
jgi:hypothetical protein